MPYSLSDDERLIQQTVRSFAQGIGLEKAALFDRNDEVPAAVLQEAAGLGLMGLALPPESGGAGPTAYALALDEVAQLCPNSAILLAVHNQALAILAQAGATADVLKPLAGGAFTSVLFTEEATGSDSLHPSTLAAADGQGFRLTGQKVWGIGASLARNHLVLADAPAGKPPTSSPSPSTSSRTPGTAQDSTTLFLVPADAPGVDLGRGEPLMGLRASGIRTVYLSEVTLGASARVGEVGQGSELARTGRAWLQVGCAAALCGTVAGALDAARGFAQTRVQFGSPIGAYQAVSDMLADTDIRLTAARSLTLAAAARLGTPEAGLWAARAKAFASEMAVAGTRAMIRVQGGTGFMREGGTERFARDARALQFVGEPGAVQRDTVRRAMLDIELGPAP